jgi:hypothetical protein
MTEKPNDTGDGAEQLDLFHAIMGDVALRDDREAMSVPLVSLRGGFQNWRASLPATRNMQALCSSDWMTKPSRS